MTNILSKSSQYAIRALEYMARMKNGSPIRVKKIAAELGIPYHYLGKILRVLTRDRLVSSRRGIRGGFELGRAAAEITLAEVVRSINGEAAGERCILGFTACDGADPCRLHHRWEQSRETMRRMLSETTIDEIGRFGKPGRDE